MNSTQDFVPRLHGGDTHLARSVFIRSCRKCGGWGEVFFTKRERKKRSSYWREKKDAVRLLCGKSLSTRSSQNCFIHIRVYGVLVFLIS